MKKIFYSLAFSGLLALPQAQAQQGYDFTQSEGYDFTQEEGYDFSNDEDEINAQKKYDEQKRTLQSLLYNGAQYSMACRKAYQEEVLWPISSCCDGITGNNDLVECTKDPVPAALHREAVSKIMAKHPFAPDAGQFVEGLLSRSTLNQAKPNLSSQQYAEIDHIITRSEELMKWFTGSFAKACALHDYDFMKEVQRVARFKEYLKSAKVEELDEKYAAMMAAYTGSYATTRVEKPWSVFSTSPKQHSVAFYRHFHNVVSDHERDQWLSHMVLGGSSRSTYTGPEFGVNVRFEHRGADDPFMYYDIRGGRVVPASTGAAAEMASYTHYFNSWTDSRINAAADLGSKANFLVKSSATELINAVGKTAGQIVVKEDADFKNIINRYALFAVDKLDSMDKELESLYYYLNENTKFVKNRKNTNSRGTLAQLIQQHVDHSGRILERIRKDAAKYVPVSDASRTQD